MKMKFKSQTFYSTIFSMLAIMFAACGNANRNQSNSTTQDTVMEDVVEVESRQAAGVSFKDEDGKTVSLDALKGKVVFINFWATWCPPCIHEMPSINEMKKSFAGNDQIVFLMVDVDNKIEQSTAFMTKNNYDLPVYTPASDIPADFLGGAIPTTVVLDKKGVIVGRMEGGRDYTDPRIINALNELIKAE
ncbi:TlpA family protein disulfide reductase [Parapedobacter sp.]